MNFVSYVVCFNKVCGKLWYLGVVKLNENNIVIFRMLELFSF